VSPPYAAGAKLANACPRGPALFGAAAIRLPRREIAIRRLDKS
jgi:hypothetical protein